MEQAEIYQSICQLNEFREKKGPGEDVVGPPIEKHVDKFDQVPLGHYLKGYNGYCISSIFLLINPVDSDDGGLSAKNHREDEERLSTGVSKGACMSRCYKPIFRSSLIFDLKALLGLLRYTGRPQHTVFNIRRFSFTWD